MLLKAQTNSLLTFCWLDPGPVFDVISSEATEYNGAWKRETSKKQKYIPPALERLLQIMQANSCSR